jgi:signal transduction histidine kinase
MKPQVIDVNDVLNGMEAMLRRLIGEDVDFQTRYAAEPGLVLADRGQVEQVIMNLAVNARDAMPSGGTLLVQTVIEDRVPANALGNEPAPYVTVVVTDTGCGFDDGVRAQIFEPFFSTKAPGEGTGLGLATVHGIVVQSGGEITVESKVGAGTSFRVSLPRVSGAPSPSAVDASAAPVGGKETILLVEDDPVVCRVAFRFLTAAGYEVLTASDSAHALLICEAYQGPIDCC